MSKVGWKFEKNKYAGYEQVLVGDLVIMDSDQTKSGMGEQSRIKYLVGWRTK
jgi:hypothetical protein